MSATSAPVDASAIVTMRYGPLVVRFVPRDPDMRLALPEPHARFRVPPDEDVAVDVEILCALGVPVVDDLPVIGGPGDVWELRRGLDGAEQIVFRAALPFGESEVMQTLSLAPGLGAGTLVRRRSPEAPADLPLVYPVDEYLGCRLAHRKQGIVLHAASVEQDGVAYMFIGHSGAGKSTVAAFAEEHGATVLSDDRTIVTVADGRVIAWGTPWHGSYMKGSASCAPVAGAFLLRQAAAFRATRLSASDAFAELFVRRIQPALDRSELEATMALLETIVVLLPVHEMMFPASSSSYGAAVRHVAAASLQA